MSKRASIAIAESCTGGLLGHRITEKPGASAYFLGGVIAYSNEIKRSVLKVPSRLIKTYGAVSEPVAVKMAEGVRHAFRADIGLGITGIAGPGGGTKEKPVGLVYIAMSKGRKTLCSRFVFKGGRSTIKMQAARKALALLGLS